MNSNAGSDRAGTGFEVTDGEHRVQIGLIDAMHDAVRQGRSRQAVSEILDQLLDYSKVHFLSEQLLMRLHAYPRYDDHVQDHDRMVAAMERLRQTHERESKEYTLETMESLRGLLINHICGRDDDLGRHLEQSGLGPASG
jgi:hemerythrin